MFFLISEKVIPYSLDNKEMVKEKSKIKAVFSMKQPFFQGGKISNGKENN